MGYFECATITTALVVENVIVNKITPCSIGMCVFCISEGASVSDSGLCHWDQEKKSQLRHEQKYGAR